MKTSIRPLLWAGTITALSLTTNVCKAEINLNDLPDFIESVSIGGGTDQFFVHSQNGYGVEGEDYTWIDSAFRINTTIATKTGIEFKFGLYYGGTFGEDYYSSVYGLGDLPVAYEGNNNSIFRVDDAYVKVNDIAGTPVDITLGKQQISIEKGFLMDEQNLQFDANVYGNGIKTSPFSVNIDVDLNPLTLQGYWTKVGTDDDMAAFLKGEDVEASGLHAHYNLGEDAFVYTGAIYYTSETEGAFDNEDITFYVGADVSLAGFNLYGEYALQTGEDALNNVDRDADAAFLFGKYTFEKLSYAPFLEVGGYYFSGDDPNTADNEDFNTMTVGFPDWGRWCSGEIFGEQLFFGLQNYRTLMAQAGFMPTGTTSIRLQYLNTEFMESSFFGAPLSSKDAADEINLVLEWFPNDSWYIALILGAAEPGDGVTEIFGGDETAFVVLPAVIYNF